MTQDEIIHMAREAGFNPDDFNNHDCECEECNFLRPMLERFAALVAEATKEEFIEIVRTIGGKFAQEAEAAIRSMK